MSNTADLSELAVTYFSAPGLARLMSALAERYKSLGRIGGSVRLEQLAAAEQKALSGLLGKDLQRHDAVTVKLTEFQVALSRTKFAGLDMVAVLQGVIGEELRSAEDERREFAAEQHRFFASLLQQFPHHRCREWLSEALHQAANARSIHTAYRRDRQGLRVDLVSVLTALSNLPVDAGVVKRLPVWATELTGDPHAFDRDTTKGRYLLHALRLFWGQTGDDLVVRDGTDSDAYLLETAGIVRDDILNFVTCYGLLAEDKNGPISSWQAALAEGAVMNVPVREVTKLRKVIPAGERNMVFVVENSGVFSDLLDVLSHLSPPLICTHGQPKLASYLLLDLLVESGITIYYSGDHDPEGLLIAQRLSDRYPASVRPWLFGADDYEAAASQVPISERRLAQLARVTLPELQEVKAKLASEGRAGYQERLLPRLVSEIRQNAGDVSSCLRSNPVVSWS